MEKIDEKELENKVIEKLKGIYDPEIPVNIYDLGLIYEIEFEFKNKLIYCYITMTLTSPGCPVADSLLDQVKYISQSLDEIFECYVELTFEPMWTKEMISQEGIEILELNGMIV